MRDQEWTRNILLAGLSLGTLLTGVAGCGGDTDGFSPEEWKRVKMVEPLASAMPGNPFDDRATDDGVARLGQKLFYEKELAEAITVTGPSGNMGETGKVSCANCHDNKYFADSRPIPISHGRTWSSRNTGSMVNLGWYTWTLWTGTFDSMVPHGTGVWGTVATPLAQAHFLYKKYRDEYNAAFPDTPLDPALDPMAPDAARFPATGGPKSGPAAADGAFEKMTKTDQWKITQMRANLGKVFDAYPRKLATPNSKFEQYIKGTDRSEASFNTRAKNGLKLFIGKASCIDCHNGPLLSDNQFHNVGVPTAMYFPPGSTTPQVQDKGRIGALAGLVNTGLATLRSNEMLVRMDPLMDQVPVFTGAGQFSADPAAGLKRITDLEAASCLPGGHSTEAVAAVCAGIFRAPREADATKTPPVTADPGDPRYAVCVEANSDLGLCARLDEKGAVVGNFDPTMEGAFRTPQLVNVAETGPYFHNGEFKTLQEVVKHYNKGGGTPGSFAGPLSPRIRPLGLTDTEVDDIVEFLKTLTGDLPDHDWACNPLLGPPNGCGPIGAGATGGAGGGGGAGRGGASGSSAGGGAGTAAGAGGRGGSTSSSSGGSGVGGASVSTGGAAVGTGGTIGAGGVGGIGDEGIPENVAGMGGGGGA